MRQNQPSKYLTSSSAVRKAPGPETRYGAGLYGGETEGSDGGGAEVSDGGGTEVSDGAGTEGSGGGAAIIVGSG